MLGKPAAFDFAVTSPLNSITLHEASVTAGSAAHATKARKHQANDVKCAELGWVSIPVVVETYGCWGTEAKWALSQLASRLAMRLNSPKSTTTASLYGRLSITFVRANKSQIVMVTLQSIFKPVYNPLYCPKTAKLCTRSEGHPGIEHTCVLPRPPGSQGLQGTGFGGDHTAKEETKTVQWKEQQQHTAVILSVGLSPSIFPPHGPVVGQLKRHSEKQLGKAQDEVKVASATAVDWYNFIRDICIQYFIDHPAVIGGPGKAPPDPKVPLAQLVLADPRTLKVTLASVDHQDKEERKEHQAAQEHQDQKAPPDPKVSPAQLVLADPRALKVTLASVDHQDKEERKEHQAAQEHQNQKVL
ncbi:hypothetical protein EMCRGX_G006130 [Ephydatia muelleri]